ncbi:MAG: hypothetical protein ABI614_20550 [Planctomycetota bacterium]
MRKTKAYAWRENVVKTALALRKKTIKEVFRDENGRFAERQYQHAQQGHKIDLSAYERLAKELNYYPVEVLFSDPDTPPPTDVVREFAHRLRVLISKGSIPIYDDKDRKTDVFDYVFRLGPGSLSSYRMTIPEYIQSFRQLVDAPGPERCLDEINRRHQHGHSSDLVGTFVIATPSQTDLLKSLEMRLEHGTQAFNDLRRDFDYLTGAPGPWLKAVRKRIERAFDEYIRYERNEFEKLLYGKTDEWHCRSEDVLCSRVMSGVRLRVSELVGSG